LESRPQIWHSLFAKCENALRSRWENLWSSEQVCVVWLVDPADVMGKLVYVATNPVKDRLVERVHQWPAVNGLGALLGQRLRRATRPRHFFRLDGKMPAAVTLQLVLPPELGDPEQLRAELRQQVAAAEVAAAAVRRHTGAGVLRRRAILRQSWRDSPASRAQDVTSHPASTVTPSPRTSPLVCHPCHRMRSGVRNTRGGKTRIAAS